MKGKEKGYVSITMFGRRRPVPGTEVRKFYAAFLRGEGGYECPDTGELQRTSLKLP